MTTSNTSTSSVDTMLAMALEQSDAERDLDPSPADADRAAELVEEQAAEALPLAETYDQMLDRVVGSIAPAVIRTDRADVPLYVSVDTRGIVHADGVRVSDDDAEVYPRSWDAAGLRDAIETALRGYSFAGGAGNRLAGLLIERARRLDRGGDVGGIRVRECPVGTWTILDGSGAQDCLMAAPGRDTSTAGVSSWAWARSGCPRTATISAIRALSTGAAMSVDVEEYVLGEPEMDCDVLPVTAFRPLTRADSLRTLPDGTDHVVQELHLAATTGKRAESRRRAAAAALCQYVLSESWSASDDLRARWVRGEDTLPGGGCLTYPTTLTDAQHRAVGVIAALEGHGIGGPGGYSGDSTARMSWAVELGKGRRQATDGAAWSAAIAMLATEPQPEDVIATLPDIRHVDLEWPMSYALSQAYAWRHTAERSSAWASVARAVYARATASDAPYTKGGAVGLGRLYGVDRPAGGS